MSKYSKPTPISNAVEKVFGTAEADANLTEILKKIVGWRNKAKDAIKTSNYNQIADCIPKLSILNTELADIIADHQITVGAYNAGFEAEKEAIYREQVAGGSSASMAYQVSGRLTKQAEAEYIELRASLESMKIIAEATRYLISDLKNVLEYNKGEILKNNYGGNKYDKTN
jgi:hypothetical protein